MKIYLVRTDYSKKPKRLGYFVLSWSSSIRYKVTPVMLCYIIIIIEKYAKCHVLYRFLVCQFLLYNEEFTYMDMYIYYIQ